MHYRFLDNKKVNRGVTYNKKRTEELEEKVYICSGIKPKFPNPAGKVDQGEGKQQKILVFCMDESSAKYTMWYYKHIHTHVFFKNENMILKLFPKWHYSFLLQFYKSFWSK